MNGYIHLTTSKTKNKPLGLCPKPPLSLARAGGRWQTLTYPYGECWSRFKASRVKCTTSSPLTPLHLRGVAKLTEADGLETCQGLRSNRVALGLYGLEHNSSVVRVQEGFPAPLPWRTRVWAAPTVLTRPLGVAQGKCAVGHSFKGFGFTRHRASSV